MLYCGNMVYLKMFVYHVHLPARLVSGRHANRQNCLSYTAVTKILAGNHRLCNIIITAHAWQIFVKPYRYKLPLHCIVTSTSKNFLRKVVSFPCSLLVNLTDLANIPCLMLTGLAVVSQRSCSSHRMWFVNSLGTRSFSCN